jgi:hypothetical protein
LAQSRIWNSINQPREDLEIWNSLSIFLYDTATIFIRYYA